MGIFRSAASLLLDDDDLKGYDSFVARLREERRHEPRVWVARFACALGAALAGFGTGFWPLGLLLAALALYGKRTRRLAYCCLFGVLVAAALLIDAITADSNLYVALLVFGGSAAVFALGFVLVLTTGITFFGQSVVRRLRRQHDVEGLIALLAAPDPVTRAKAADALAPLADPRAEQRLLQALADSDLDVRANAARALGVLRSEAAVEPLIQAIGDPTVDVRYAAAWALGQIGDPRAIEPLRQLVSDEDSLVQDGARDALRSLDGTAAGQR